MKLQEIHDGDFDEADRRYDAKVDAMRDKYDADHKGNFVIKEYDGVQPDDFIVDMFDIAVSYESESDDYTDHPYGVGSAREYHYGGVHVIKCVARGEVVYRDPETDEVKKTFPKGTDCQDLPGWNSNDDKFVQSKAEEHA